MNPGMVTWAHGIGYWELERGLWKHWTGQLELQRAVKQDEVRKNGCCLLRRENSWVGHCAVIEETDWAWNWCIQFTRLPLSIALQPLGTSLNFSKLISFYRMRIMISHMKCPYYEYMCVCVLSCSVTSDSATPWTIACQALLSMGFSKQECWSGLPFSTPGNLPNSGMNPCFLYWQAESLPLAPPGHVLLHR